MNRLFFLRAPLSRALGLLAATLMLNACERVWDNPADPEAPNYQGYTSVKTANEIEAVTSDGTETIYQSFLVNEVLDAQAYRLEIATDKQFSKVIYRDDTLTSNFLGAKASLNRDTTYYWRGSAKKDGVWGKWTEGRRFKLANRITSMNPASGSSTTDITPEFSWSAVAGATNYEIQIADSEANLEINPTVDDKNVSGASYTPTALTNLQMYHWRVRAVDGEGQAGAWSGTQTLNINFDTVSGLNPADGSDITNTTPEFSWNAVVGADKYEIQIADSAANLAGSSAVNVPGTSYTPTTALTNLQTHHWRVRAVDGEGQFGAWSGPFSFSIFAPINYEFRLAFVGQPYSLSLANALPSVTYSVSPALPDGLNLDTSTGRIYGTPTTRQFVKDYSITVTPTSGGRSATATVSLFVKETAKDKDDLWRIIDEEIEAQGNTADLNLIDTSKITDMSHLFNSNTHSSDSHADYSAFNGDISGWDVSGVKDMSQMFDGARAFNGNISGWDVSGVEGMREMFSYARAFNGDISSWNVSGVKNMSWMFEEAHAFNGDISGWDVSNVKDMSYMFNWARAFNGNISEWDVSGVTDMSRMFSVAYAFNGDISGWDVSNVKSMSGMFRTAYVFNGDIASWDVSGVTDMSEMFSSAVAFNRDISEWDVSGVKDMREMFSGADAFNGNLSGWDVSGVKDMSQMFDGADAFNGDIASWNVSNVTNMRRMFSRAVAFNGDISEWNVSGVKSMSGMFNASAFNGDISSWNVSGVKDMRSMFLGTVFNGDIASWNVSNVTDMSWMFSGADAFNGNIASWNVSGVTNMSYMFTNATAFNGDIASWNVSGVTNMRWMFNGARAFNRNLEPWGVHLSGREVYMSGMFNASGLENTPPSWY